MNSILKNYSLLTTTELINLISKLTIDSEKYAAQLQFIYLKKGLPISESNKLLDEILSKITIESYSEIYCFAILLKSRLKLLIDKNGKFEYDKTDEKKLLLQVLLNVAEQKLKNYQLANSLIHYQTALNLSDELKDNYSHCKVRLRLAFLNFLKKDFVNAKIDFEKSEQLAVNQNFYDLQVVAKCGISKLYFWDSKRDKTFELLNESLKIALKHNLHEKVAMIYGKFSLVAKGKDKLKWIKLAINYEKEHENDENNLLKYYAQCANINIHIKNIEEGLKYSEKAVLLAKKNPTKSNYYQSHSAYLDCLLNKIVIQGKNKSSKIIKQALQLCDEYSTVFAKSESEDILHYINIRKGVLFFYQKKFDLSLKSLLKYWNVVKKQKVKKADGIILSALDYIFKNYEMLKDYKNAFKFHKEYLERFKQLKHSEAVKNTEELEIKFESKLKESEVKRLQEMEEIKARFFSQITHELRTPLTLIKGPTKNILQSDDLVKINKNAKIIDRNTDRLLLLVNQLLDVNKLESGKMQVKNSVGYFDEFVDEIIAPFKTLAKQTNIKFTVETNFKNLYLNFDADKVEKIISNLLSNAFKFTNEGKEIELSIEKTKAKKKDFCNLKIVVKDFGVGIAKEHLPNIFDRFYQADNSLTRKAEGTGIGLALVKEITELLNGEIEVSSKINKGTTFTVYLSLESTAINLSKSKEVKAKSQVNITFFGDKEKRITPKIKKNKNAPILLIIEDNEDMHEYIESIFADDYKVLKAINGKNGIEIAKNKIPDVIISDIMMPIKNGYEVCEELKLNETTSHIPIILLTAKAALKSRIEGFEKGADAYLSKPFSAEELSLQTANLIATTKSASKTYKNLILKNEKLNDEKNQEAIFLKKAIDIINANSNNNNFGVDMLAKLMNMSTSKLFRKLNALTGNNIVEFIKIAKLSKARSLLLSKKVNVTEVAFQIGLDPGYFSKAFKKQYGISPVNI